MGLLDLLARQYQSSWLVAQGIHKLDAAVERPIGDVAADWEVVVAVLAHAGRRVSRKV